MRKKIILGTLLILITNIFANDGCIDRGKEIYDRELKTKCQINAYGFAEKHTQDEWEDINDADKISVEINKICKKTIKLDKKSLFNLYNFFYEYASDGEGGGCGF